MDLSKLQAVQSKERQKDDLQQLPAEFYEEAGELAQSLREEREALSERVDDPFSNPEIQELTDSISMVEKIVTAIHERRMGKIVKAASLAAAGMTTEADGLTTEEQELFDNLISELETSRETVLSNLDASPPSQSPVTEPEKDTQPEPPSQVHEPENEPESKNELESNSPETKQVDETPAPVPNVTTESNGIPRQRVQVLADVGEILGVDEREYQLEEHDIVSLPEANAEALISKDAATVLD